MYFAVYMKVFIGLGSLSYISDNTGKGFFMTLSFGHSEKGYQFQNVEHTVWGNFCSPLLAHRYTVDQQVPPTPGGQSKAS